MSFFSPRYTCWAVYFYRSQYYLIQCVDYSAAKQLLNSFAEKPAVDPLGVYQYRGDEFFWELRTSFSEELIKARHQPRIAEEIETLKTQLKIP